MNDPNGRLNEGPARHAAAGTGQAQTTPGTRHRTTIRPSDESQQVPLCTGTRGRQSPAVGHNRAILPRGHAAVHAVCYGRDRETWSYPGRDRAAVALASKLRGDQRAVPPRRLITRSGSRVKGWSPSLDSATAAECNSMREKQQNGTTPTIARGQGRNGIKNTCTGDTSKRRSGPRPRQHRWRT